MRSGLFGKLPAKRDFVALGAPREFLGVWEAWIQGGISASRQRLAEGWQAAFLRAPIWRFWLGADLCGGAPVLGAFMPSVDGVGRYFPLTVFTRAAEPDDDLPPPELDAHEAWLADAEDILLSALADGMTYEALGETVGSFAGPRPDVAAVDELRRFPDGTLVGGGAPAEVFAAMRMRDHARLYGRMSYWWTLGGEGFPPRALAQRGLPDAYLFTAMLTGGFDVDAG